MIHRRCHIFIELPHASVYASMHAPGHALARARVSVLSRRESSSSAGPAGLATATGAVVGRLVRLLQAELVVEPLYEAVGLGVHALVDALRLDGER